MDLTPQIEQPCIAGGCYMLIPLADVCHLVMYKKKSFVTVFLFVVAMTSPLSSTLTNVCGSEVPYKHSRPKGVSAGGLTEVHFMLNKFSKILYISKSITCQTLTWACRSCWDLVNLGSRQSQLVALKLEGYRLTSLT